MQWQRWKSSMQVWFINHYAGLPATVPATRPYDLGRQLVRLGHQVTIFACSFNHYTLSEEHLRFGQLVKVQESEGVRLVWVRGTPYRKNGLGRIFNMLVFGLLALIIGVRIQPRPDVVIGTTVHSLTPIGAFFLARLRKAHFWLDITDIWPESLVDLGHLRAGGLAAKILGSLEEFSLRHAQVVTSVVPNISAYVRDKGLGDKPTIWVPNGIDPTRLPSFVESGMADRSGFTVMYAGGFAPAHALNVILAAAVRIQSLGYTHIRFALVGDGPEMGNVKSCIEEHGLTNVRLHGFVSKTSVYAVLQEADAFVVAARNLPVYRYGMSFNKVFDYMLVGRPVIFAVNSSNNPIGDASGGLNVQGEDPMALAEAVIQLSEMPAGVRREMGKRARDFVLSEFDYPVIAKRLASFF
jgi:glycosyltransferase involved in cell wall biosynthesis